MATEHSTASAVQPVRAIVAELEAIPARGRALDLFAQDEGFNSFAEWAAHQFIHGASIRFDVEQADLFLDPHEGQLFGTAKDALAAFGKRYRTVKGFRITGEVIRPES